jgi:predicted DNA binding CopG/RHH family protein
MPHCTRPLRNRSRLSKRSHSNFAFPTSPATPLCCNSGTNAGRVLAFAYTKRGRKIRPITAHTAPRKLRKPYAQQKSKKDDLLASVRTPRFRSEAEEAAWWDKNLNRILETGLAHLQFRQALKTVTMRLPEGDLTLARSIGAKLGLRYQTYLKSVIHAALQSDAKRSLKVVPNSLAVKHGLLERAPNEPCQHSPLLVHRDRRGLRSTMG